MFINIEPFWNIFLWDNWLACVDSFVWIIASRITPIFIVLYFITSYWFRTCIYFLVICFLVKYYLPPIFLWVNIKTCHLAWDSKLFSENRNVNKNRHWNMKIKKSWVELQTKTIYSIANLYLSKFWIHWFPRMA